MPWPVSLCEICALIPAFIVTDLADRPQPQRDALVLLETLGAFFCLPLAFFPALKLVRCFS